MLLRQHTGAGPVSGKPSRLTLSPGGLLADFKHMKNFNDKNIYNLLTLLMEDQISIKAEHICYCCLFVVIEDPIPGLINY